MIHMLIQDPFVDTPMLNRTYSSTPALETDDLNLPSCHLTFLPLTMLLSSVQKIFTLVVFSSAAVCCAVLGILLLVQDNIAKAGIATLTVRAYSNPFGIG
ncbi:MAG: hypothetical protein CL912_19040 [Deltaproteobacteria bacterium]|nr:hypothetical protein [Deltaproteobacteria bacterium]